MRLFTGIDLPDEARARLDRLLTHLRPTAHLHWSPVYNLHVTTKFLGEQPEDRMDAIKAALSGLPRREAIHLSVNGLGWFPNPHSPRVLWAGVHAGPALVELARDTEAALQPLGVPVEKRAYNPHLTLARIAQPAPLAPVRQAIAKLESVEFGEFHAACFYLYLSQTGAAGAVYTKLAEFRFAE